MNCTALLVIVALSTSSCDVRKSAQQQRKVGLALTKIIVAAQDLERGAFLSTDHVELGEMPRKFVPESMLVPSDMEVALGREVVTPIKKGDPIFWHLLQGISSRQTIGRSVRKHRRAVLLEVGPTAGLIGLHDRVDILYASADPRGSIATRSGLLAVYGDQAPGASAPQERVSHGPGTGLELTGFLIVDGRLVEEQVFSIVAAEVAGRVHRLVVSGETKLSIVFRRATRDLAHRIPNHHQVPRPDLRAGLQQLEPFLEPTLEFVGIQVPHPGLAVGPGHGRVEAVGRALLGSALPTEVLAGKPRQ